MKVICSRCRLEGIRFEKGFKMSRLIHLWLCNKCDDLLGEEFAKFRDEFLEAQELKQKTLELI